MPAVIVGGVKVTSVAGNGTVNMGDVLQIAPKSTTKAYSGAGGGNTGDFLLTNTFCSVTNTLDSDLKDSSNVANR
ncbi:spore germination protein [Thermaerobacillus caldiproteolyticus]|uniref:Spore germination protein PF n=1 Tax=Thermaerobacillus caldiproteolyticus TaxID=247480 RepID=A0A7W0BZW4_9BACL|nr:spore germination protein [Anoxybacillus caldiproteolyticus]MBA2874856.1 spore germination protein PF [Anoxybacillus caldiproteolyticus]QPA33061.1 spore germination protein [Anoxybacillus caldiproteolyticus]